MRNPLHICNGKRKYLHIETYGLAAKPSRLVFEMGKVGDTISKQRRIGFMKRLRKVISLVLTLSMIAGSAVTAAFAASPTDEMSEREIRNAELSRDVAAPGHGFAGK